MIKEGKKAFPEIMIPVVMGRHELRHQKEIVDRVYAEVCEKMKIKSIPYLYGTMIETPRNALKGDSMATVADFSVSELMI